MTKIAVAGGGSIGLLLAGRIALAGKPVTVWTRAEAQARALAASGVAVCGASGETIGIAPVTAMTLDQAQAERDPAHVVLLAVKQTALSQAFLDALRAAVPPGAAVAAFCNGLGHTERLAAALPGRHLLAAVTTEGARRTGPAAVRHTGSGNTWLGDAPLFDGTARDAAVPADPAKLQIVEKVLKEAGFTAIVSNDMAERMLRKLLSNAVINPLTALLRVPNGQLTATRDRLRLMRTLFDETVPVLRQYGLPNDPALWDELLDVCARTAANRSSMLQDVEAGRPTEIGAINGAVSRLARQAGLPAPWNGGLTALIEAIPGDGGDV
ncbi:ketopantoate reductase family protein [Cohnella nanjingensis]|uniref:2-dehydropantoate 2-reductase n=1 Tax=Cohnella nanjingensis TaxID=1387779 RepID=A0A7X0RW65_9BACL|nr:ketopantoate reductase family protein [Cohnella nanjingensis]MBB6673234.1 ketopantoate reductase family protein [Cohnella nanjingensis]